VNVTRENEVSSPGQIIATLFIPLGLWIGSLAVFLVMRPVTRRTLSSTAGNGRLVLSAIARASVVTAAQALLLVGLLHVAVGVSWALLPATILFSLVMAVAFTAFHYLLTIGLGRAGLVVSIFLLAVQITSTGGLYPIQLLAAPFQFISPFLPLTYGVAGMQAIISDSGVGNALLAAFALVAFGLGSLVVALLAVRRVRRARALGLVPAIA
jgi:putative membrane protein